MANRNNNNCCVDGCRNKQRDSALSFFKLPQDSTRCNKWLEVIGRSDLLKRPNLKPDSYKVCSEHFDDSMVAVVIKRKLHPDAIPTVKIPSDSQARLTTLKCEKGENLQTTSDVATQTEITKLKVDKDEKSADRILTDTQVKEMTAPTSAAPSSTTSRKRELRSQLKVSRSNKRLVHELERIKNQFEVSSSCSSSNERDDLLENFPNKKSSSVDSRSSSNERDDLLEKLLLEYFPNKKSSRRADSCSSSNERDDLLEKLLLEYFPHKRSSGRAEERE